MIIGHKNDPSGQARWTKMASGLNPLIKLITKALQKLMVFILDIFQ